MILKAPDAGFIPTSHPQPVLAVSYKSICDRHLFMIYKNIPSLIASLTMPICLFLASNSSGV